MLLTQNRTEAVPMFSRFYQSLMLICLLLCQSIAVAEEQAAKISLGNGENNSITVEGVSRDGSILTFPQVTIDGNGWLVMHPFEDGKPNGDKYVAATYVTDGANKDVSIEVYKGIESGENFIVMLHRDVNENKVLDFVFVDDKNVMDTAVFEGTRMIAHVIAAP